MAEWLKAAVLKTAVRETVPGVRIPLSPPTYTAIERERRHRDPVRAAEAIYEVVASDRPRHWVILGSDAYRLIGTKLDKLRAEYDAGKEMALSTDYPGAGRAIL